MHNAIRNVMVNSHEKRYIDDFGIVRKKNINLNFGGFPIYGGTTCSLVVCIKNSDNPKKYSIITSNVGDSHVFLFEQNNYKQLNATIEMKFI